MEIFNAFSQYGNVLVREDFKDGELGKEMQGYHPNNDFIEDFERLYRS